MARTIRWDRWLLIIGIPYGLLLTVLLPPPVYVDTPYHLLRLDQISHGQLVSPLEHGKAIAHPSPCVGSYVQSILRRDYVQRMNVRQGFRSVPCGRPFSIDMGHAAINSPMTYVPQVIGYVAGRALGGVLYGAWGAKLFGLAAYLALCWLAIRVAPRGKPVLLICALLPTAIALAASVSSDPMGIALGMLAVALLLRLREVPAGSGQGGDAPSSRCQLLELGTCLVLLALAKNLYAPAALLVLLVPKAHFRGRGARLGSEVAVLGSVLLAAGLWSVLVVNRVTQNYMPYFNTTEAGQKLWISQHPIGFARIMFRSVFGTDILVSHTVPGMVAMFAPFYGRSVAPLGMTLVVLALGAFALLLDRRVSPVGGRGADAARRREAQLDRVLCVGVTLLVLACVMGLVLYGEALVFTPNLKLGMNIAFIEGRYFLPILPLLVLVPGSRAAVPGMAAATQWTALRRWAWIVPLGVVVVAGWYGILLAQQFY